MKIEGLVEDLCDQCIATDPANMFFVCLCSNSLLCHVIGFVLNFVMIYRWIYVDAGVDVVVCDTGAPNGCRFLGLIIIVAFFNV